MTGHEIRRGFLRYFERHDHRVVPSSSLVPKDDPTLLFTNAGMVQFKRVFLGQERRDYVRAVSAQKCVRAGGKHNDLENVGRTARHHTFFEMLGNFSFGDYFKEGAIAYAWEFLTQELALPRERLWITIFQDDDEAHALWQKVAGVPAERIVRCGEKDNFWAMGDTGPCGPCSEILIDQGVAAGCGRPACAVGCDCDRFLELWNLVFMQFDRDETGRLTPLPKPSIDTGAGLERLAAVLQGVASNYDTDLLRPLIRFVEREAKLPYGAGGERDVSMRVMADHTRAMTFLIADGVLPSNEGRGYVLRRIMRRAARHARMLGFTEPVLYRLSGEVVALMGEAYPELREQAAAVAAVIRNEEERFGETLDHGLRLLREEVERLTARGATVLPGEVVFRLYDTYGFPADLTADILRDQGLTIDLEGFEREMARQQAASRQAHKAAVSQALAGRAGAATLPPSRFRGYETRVVESEVTGLFDAGWEPRAELAAGAEGFLTAVETPFYPEGGGQVGDTGVVVAPGGRARVLDTASPARGVIVHRIRVEEGRLAAGERVRLEVDAQHRIGAMANHTGTHLLHAALRRVLGPHATQAGSLVAPDRLRFDFTHFAPLTDEQKRTIEEMVNQVIVEDRPVAHLEIPYDEAKRRGAIGLFEGKYDEIVRVIEVPDFSIELCGGTHVRHTGQIGFFKILSDQALASGVRRLEAIAGPAALRVVQQWERTLQEAAAALKARPDELVDRIAKLKARQQELERRLEQARRAGPTRAADLLARAKAVAGTRLVAARVEPADPRAMRELADELKARLRSGIVVLGGEANGKALLVVALTRDLTDRYDAGAIAREVAAVVGGSGGGRRDMAQAGGNRPEALDRALAQAEEIVARLSAA
ncbi:MAG TPA: alanine--tRNA ligase [Thermodesulfobacteriota bacterium]|nr:alanine--tRNA ligase [Thermodesulfobacteriota bacterium]